ncbi:MAG: hypothetical protein A2289_22710 [Deltaproteobacteria bacterium RIFOXYA12_FULL_58_15]|nr:MAG: hypothetical protein A2289_22710 [Deltaproteobacteria bacterium RIFOXYA12_FULL_58_15]OGR12772.1 MAG: hypothetical protein A2341_21805 [Deltaproteobacteria bacterium RIFOXYB12_FULL_58_9]
MSKVENAAGKLGADANPYTRSLSHDEQRLRDIAQELEGKKSSTYRGIPVTKSAKDQYVDAIRTKASKGYYFQTVMKWIYKSIPINSLTQSQLIDGGLIGGDKCVHPPTDSLRMLPAIVSSSRTEKTEVSPENCVDIISVNGIMTTAEDQYNSMHKQADCLSAPIDSESGLPLGKQAEFRGVHNGTDGYIRDLIQCLTDKLFWGKNLAVATLREKIIDRVGTGKPVNILAHSQGGIVTARALTEVRVMLQEGLGLSRQDALEFMSKTINVVTLGAAAWQYPSGANYLHVANQSDPVAMFAGAGVEDGLPHGTLAKIGRGAAKLGHKLHKVLPTLTNDYKFPWYFGAGKDTPNTKDIVAGEFSKHWGIKMMVNHYVDGPYAEYLRQNREPIMDFFATADMDVSAVVAQYISPKT